MTCKQQFMGQLQHYSLASLDYDSYKLALIGVFGTCTYVPLYWA